MCDLTKYNKNYAGRLFWLVSETYYTLTQRKYVYNIMPIDNISSIITNGILCYHRAEKLLNHTSIAMNDVQSIREQVTIHEKSLHDYANLYFSFRNPMMYKSLKNIQPYVKIKKFDLENLTIILIHLIYLY